MIEMNNQIYTEEQVRQLARDETNRSLKKHLKSTTWFNPVESKFYEADNPNIENEPQYDRYVADGKTFGYGVSQLNTKGAGLNSTEIDNYQYGGIANEYLQQAQLMWEDFAKLKKQMKGDFTSADAIKGAGVITTQSYPALANIMVDSQVLELLARDFVLEQAVTRKTSDKLTWTGYNITPYLNEGDLGELDLIDARELSYEQKQISLKKAQGHVAASKWAEMAIRDRPIVQDNFSIIDADFPRIYATEIAAGLTAFADVGATGQYDVIGAGDFHSTTIPQNDFLTHSATIRTAGGRANTLAMNSSVFQALVQNTFMRAGDVTFAAVPALTNTGSRTATHSMLPGYSIYIDELLPNSTIYQYDKQGIIFIQGPSRTSTVDDNKNWIVSQIVDHWYGVGLRATSFGIEITTTN